MGEEFAAPASPRVPRARTRLYAAFIRSLDAQGRLLALAVRATGLGGVLTLAVWVWILAEKML